MNNNTADTGLKPPGSLSAALGEKSDEIDLHWDPVPGANSYAVEVCVNKKNMKWEMVDVSSVSRYTVTGLKQNTTYCFRVSGLNNDLQGAWSGVSVKKR